MSGTLYLIPVPIGDAPIPASIPAAVPEIARSLEHFVAENPKTARQMLKRLGVTRPLQEISITTLDEHTPAAQIAELLAPLQAGKDVGLMSEAGCPAVADPGAQLVHLAHRQGIRVVPLVGPSSILLALMGSGMNGQSFAFLGYLPADKEGRIARILEIEKESRTRNQTQIFIETPYRNPPLLADLLQTCHPETQLCLATHLTQPDEAIRTASIAEWRKAPTTADIHKKPTVFLLYRPEPHPRGKMGDKR